MGLLDEIARNVVVGIGVEHGKDATGQAARGVAEQAGDAEHEASYIDGPIAAPLWGAYVARLTEAGVIAQDQAAIVAVLLSQRDSELDRIVRELRSDSPTIRSRAVYGVAGDQPVLVELPDLPDNGQQWALDSVTAWADFAAAGDVLVQLGGQTTGLRGGSMFAVPAQFAAPKANVVSIPFKMPARTGDTVRVQFVAGAGGAAGDRAAVIFTYKRG